MQPQEKKFIFIGFVCIITFGLLTYIVNIDSKEGYKNNTDQNKATPAVWEDFYAWYKQKEAGALLENPKQVVTEALAHGFITPEFATSTITHPLTKSKSADVFVCASKKEERAFPTQFIPMPTDHPSTSTFELYTKSDIPNHTLRIMIKENKISAVVCTIIAGN